MEVATFSSTTEEEAIGIFEAIIAIETFIKSGFTREGEWVLMPWMLKLMGQVSTR